MITPLKKDLQDDFQQLGAIGGVLIAGIRVGQRLFRYVHRLFGA